MKVISIKGGTMSYLFFMVIKLCWQAFLCLKCNLIAIANLGSGCAIETSNLDTDISEMNFVGFKRSDKKLKWCTNLWKYAKFWIFAKKCFYTNLRKPPKIPHKLLEGAPKLSWSHVILQGLQTIYKQSASSATV